MARASFRRRTMVIGLDGATWKLVDRLVEEGVMPHLGRLKGEGTHGPLWSVVPPMTATAWTSMQTGKGPGRHGIYDWTEPVPGTYLYRPIDSTRVQSRTMFEQLSERGGRVASVNLPLTYPARPVNGFAVGDMLTPDKGAPGFTHPPEFVAELERLVPDYLIDTHLTDSLEDLLPFLGRLRQMIEGKGRLNAHLLAQEAWDLYCCIWVEMDRMQHCVWHILDATHPAHDPALAKRFREPILDVYRALDTQIAAMMASRPADANVLFVSDHGFGPCRYKVFLNTWLAQEGFLVFKEEGDAHATRARLNRVRGWMDRAGLDTRKLIEVARRVGGDAALKFGGQNLSRFASEIDWSRTQAYCHGTNAIRLNLEGREPGGSVRAEDAPEVLRRLREKLLSLRDPEGTRIVTGVRAREELYEGPHVDLAADLLITHHDDSVWFYYSEGEVPEAIFEPSGWASGNHEPDGLFLGWGPDFRPGQRIEEANIVDILPTIFATMGVPIPDDIDGRVLHEAFSERIPVRWTEARAFEGAAAPEGARSAAVDRAIEERLRGLGYLQ